MLEVPVPAYSCYRCKKPLIGLYKVFEGKYYCSNCFNLLQKGTLDEDLMKVLWRFADDEGKIPLEREGELMQELVRITGTSFRALYRLKGLERTGYIKLPEHLKADVCSRMLCVLRKHAGEGGKLEGEALAEAIRELAVEFSNTPGWVRYWLRSLEEMGYVRLHYRKFNRLVGLTILQREEGYIRLLSDVGKPKPRSPPPGYEVVSLRSKATGKELRLLVPKEEGK